MLAAANDYFQVWQLPILLIVIFGWLVFGGHFFRKSLTKYGAERKVSLGKGILVSFLTGLVAGIPMLIVYKACALLTDSPASILGLIAALIVYLVMAYMVVFALHKKLDAKNAMHACIVPLGFTLLFAAVILTPTGIITYNQRMAVIAQEKLVGKTMRNLREIYIALRRKGIDRPPLNLTQLVREKFIEAEYIKSPANSAREVGFFYIPTDILAADREKQKIIACDFADNFDDDIRVILLSSGETMQNSELNFQELLEMPVNKKFKEALMKAESK